MQQVFTNELRRRRPGVIIYIASPFPKIDTHYYAPTTVVKSYRRRLPISTLNWLVLETFRSLNRQPIRYFGDTEINAMCHADAVVDLSGDMLTEDYGALVGYSHFLPLLQAQALGKPVIICAQSIGPFHRLTRLAHSILSRASLITVRESASSQLLAELDDPTITPILTADLAFLLPTSPQERIDALLAAEGIPDANRSRLGVSVSALLSNGSNRHLGTSTADNLDAFAQALDAVMDKLGVEVLLVPHVFGPRPSGDDRQAGERLASRMRNQPLQLQGEYRPEELKGVIARCDAFVGCRMHANIAALDSGVPVLAIGYNHKTRGILADLGLADWLVCINDLNPHALSISIERLFVEAPAYRQRLAAQLPFVRQRASHNFNLTLHAIDTAMNEHAHK